MNNIIGIWLLRTIIISMALFLVQTGDPVALVTGAGLIALMTPRPRGL